MSSIRSNGPPHPEGQNGSNGAGGGGDASYPAAVQPPAPSSGGMDALHDAPLENHLPATARPDVNRLRAQAAGSLSGIQIRLEKSPVAFSHLYAALERRVAGTSDTDVDASQMLGGDRPYVLGVTSAVVGEGKTTVALHLAMNAARNTFSRVCLIDLGLGDDDLCRRLGVRTGDEGVVNILEGTGQTLPTLQLAGCDNLVIMPAGKEPENPARSARSGRVGEVIEAARNLFDTVIVDLPAVSTDNVLPLARHMDGVLMVARAGATPNDVINDALNYVGRNRVLGVVLNRVRSSSPNWLRKRLLKV